MKRDLAEELMYTLRRCVGLLEHAAWLTRQHGTEEEFLNCKEAVAQVLAGLRTQILCPIFAEYPELDLSSPAYSMEPGGAYPGGALLGERYHPGSGGARGDRKDAGIDKELAAHLNYFFVHCSHLVILALRVLELQGLGEEDEEFVRHKEAVGYVLAEMGFQFFYDLGNKYPDIDPLSPSYIGDRAIHDGTFMDERPKCAGLGDLNRTAKGPSRKYMDKDIANRIAYISRQCAGLLRHTVWLVKQQGTEEEFVDYKEAMGRVLVELQTRILDPLYAEHPELDPKSPTYSGSYGERMMESYLQEDEGPRDDTVGYGDPNT